MPEKRFDSEGNMFTATKKVTILINDIDGKYRLCLYAKNEEMLKEVLKKAKEEFDKDPELKYGEDYVFEKVEDI